MDGNDSIEFVVGAGVLCEGTLEILFRKVFFADCLTEGENYLVAVMDIFPVFGSKTEIMADDSVPRDSFNIPRLSKALKLRERFGTNPFSPNGCSIRLARG